ncbi:hypothetical protein [Mucilaginibacter sp.]
MPNVNKHELHALIVEISKLSNNIDELKKKRDFLLDKFKNVQLTEEKPKSPVKSL